MLKNYFKVALRNLARQKTFSFINIAGLGIGLAAAIVIFLWIQFETGVDGFHRNREKLYQVMEHQKYGDGSLFTFTATPAPLAGHLKQQFPEITHATRVTWGNTYIFHQGDRHIEEFGLYVDPDFLQMF